MNESYEYCKATNADCGGCTNRFFFKANPQYRCHMKEFIEKSEKPKVIEFRKQLSLSL